MTLSGFRVAPHQGHLDRVKRICGYLSRMSNACIRIRTDVPDYSEIQTMVYDWADTVYGDVKELIPDDAPELLGLIETPINWYTKKQTTVETATYGSEFNAARTCVEQVNDLRTTLRYLGILIAPLSYVFGNNEAVINLP